MLCVFVIPVLMYRHVHVAPWISLFRVRKQDDLLRPQILFIVIKWSCVHAIVRLVVQRTKLIDETQEILLELLEEMTTGTMVM